MPWLWPMPEPSARRLRSRHRQRPVAARISLIFPPVLVLLLLLLLLLRRRLLLLLLLGPPGLRRGAARPPRLFGFVDVLFGFVDFPACASPSTMAPNKTSSSLMAPPKAGDSERDRPCAIGQVWAEGLYHSCGAPGGAWVVQWVNGPGRPSTQPSNQITTPRTNIHTNLANTQPIN